MYPLLLKPVFKDYLWGGVKLNSLYNKNSGFEKTAESWELACHKDGQSIVANGKYSGMPLGEYIKNAKTNVLGNSKELPLLAKLIDTMDSLSVQVHPDDEYSLLHEAQNGKIELWYIMDCEKDAQLYFGFNKDLSKEEFAQAIKEGSITQVLNGVKVAKGDVFVINSGTVHAIGKNMTVAEIGTNCNVTYRIYDFDRTDAQGNKRELHIKQATDVAVLKKQPKAENKGVFDCGPFVVEVLNIKNESLQNAEKSSFHYLICTQNSGQIIYNNEAYPINTGESYFIPANMGEYTIKGDLTVLKTTV